MTIRANNLSFDYSNARNVLESIDFDVNDGVFVSLIGPNGSGKSTLLKCLMNILQPKSGAVFIDQNEISKLQERDLAKLRSAVLSDRVYPFNMTVRELISLGRYPHQKLFGSLDETEENIILQSAFLLGVQDLLQRKFSELSDGQKQKVLIARAICQKPKVLILDEPATHLDPSSRVEILLKLRKISSQEKIIVIASMHEIEICFRISDQIIILENGKIVAKGTPEQILHQRIVNKIYKNEEIVWCPLLCSLEIKCKKDYPKIHVVSANGTGIPVFRLLTRLGYSFSVGMLDYKDMDFYFAKEIEANVFCINFDSTEDKIKDMTEKLDKIRIIVDTGFEINRYTKPNVELLRLLCKKNQTLVLSLRSQEEGVGIFGDSVNVRYLNIVELGTVLDELLTNSLQTKEIAELI